MKPKHRRLLRNPTSLKVVAALCFLMGGIGVWKTLLGISRSHCMIDPGLLGFFAAPGLLRHRNGWRICVLIFTGLGLLVGLVMVLFLVAGMFFPVEREQSAPLIQPSTEQPAESSVDQPVLGGRHGAREPFRSGVWFERSTLAPGQPLLQALYYLTQLALNFWVMYVLLRPEIRSLFVKKSPAVVGPDPAASPESPSSDNTTHE
ncbi:MAG: hypothetical protein AAF368_13145 [Planctomycetota bacterium]